MKQQLFIVNNALRDQRGHYFETSISIAEAARRAGMRPILGTHATCPVELFPDWLEVYPIFTTDHWMSDPPAAPASVPGLQANPFRRRRVSVGDVRDGQATFKDFVLDRFIPLECLPASDCTSSQKKKSVLRRTLGAPLETTAWLVGRLAFYLVPEIIYDSALAGYRGLKRFAPRGLRNPHRRHLLERARRLSRWLGEPQGLRVSDTGAAEEDSGSEIDERFWLAVGSRSAAQNFSREIEYSKLFKRDLERLLGLVGCTANDHVLLGTAHARELIAVQSLVKRFGDDRSPRFHLEYRHPVFHAEPSVEEMCRSPAVQLLQFFTKCYKDLGPTDRIRLYTDTDQLSEEYRLAAGLRFGRLPIPFRAELVKRESREPQPPLTLVFLGEARDEKGFHWLPALVEALFDEWIMPGRVRLVAQATVGDSRYNPHSIFALHRLLAYPPEQVSLVGIDKPLEPTAYFELISAADAVLLPYDRDRYRAASSGTLAEALAAGVPTVVPARSWMSAQVTPGCGETFEDQEEFLGAVRQILTNYRSYYCCAQSQRHAWVTVHSPTALVEALSTDPTQQRAGSSRAA